MKNKSFFHQDKNDTSDFQSEEQRLLAILRKNPANRLPVLEELVELYADAQQLDQALDCLRQLVALTTDPETKARHILNQGTIAERKRDYESAIRFYRRALAHEPERTDVWYFIHNNLGFSLNQVGRYVEGEKICREAIEIDPHRANAYKNLGLALAGQGRYAEAAESYAQATVVNPCDPRSLELLRQLLQVQLQLAHEYGEILIHCENLVKSAHASRPHL